MILVSGVRTERYLSTIKGPGCSPSPGPGPGPGPSLDPEFQGASILGPGP